jgi:hypothetical protein
MPTSCGLVAPAQGQGAQGWNARASHRPHPPRANRLGPLPSHTSFLISATLHYYTRAHPLSATAAMYTQSLQQQATNISLPSHALVRANNRRYIPRSFVTRARLCPAYILIPCIMSPTPMTAYHRHHRRLLLGASRTLHCCLSIDNQICSG